MTDITLPLTPIQVRILGCLFEKQHTTPDQYPLTLNALKNACNQKSNRNPVVNYFEGEIGKALNDLEAVSLVRNEWSGRTQKYQQRLPQVLELQHPALSILAVLMLRGPQTAGEIRNHCQRLHLFDDIDDVDYQLQRMAEAEPVLVMQLPRQPGQKEQRFMHLLAGEPDLESLTIAPVATTAPATPAHTKMEERISTLETVVKSLQERLNTLENQ